MIARSKYRFSSWLYGYQTILYYDSLRGLCLIIFRSSTKAFIAGQEIWFISCTCDWYEIHEPKLSSRSLKIIQIIPFSWRGNDDTAAGRAKLRIRWNTDYINTRRTRSGMGPRSSTGIYIYIGGMYQRVTNKNQGRRNGKLWYCAEDAVHD